MSKYKGKNVLVVGFGVSGVSTAKFMVKQGAKVTVTDSKQRTELSDSLKMAGDLKMEMDFGKHTPRSFETAELIVVSPGVPLNLKPLEEARARGTPITSEVEVASAHIQVPIIGITGTNGKSTITALVGEMFKEDGRAAFVGGNIGLPLLDFVLSGDKVDVVVAELSSYQLELASRMVPAVAVFTNMDQDHLDRYGTMENYIAAKKNLLRVCDRNSFVVLNYDCPIVSQFEKENPGKLLWFTKRDPMRVGGAFAENFMGAYVSDDGKTIVSRILGKEDTYDLAQFKLVGDHAKENLMAAICAARVQGVSPKAIQRVIDSFRGLPHRLEYVRKKDGVFFFNDSKATNVHSVMKALAAFKKSPVILIAGGKDKGMEFTPLVPFVQGRVKMLILLGEAKEKLNRAIGDFAETFLVGTFEEAVLLAYQKSRSGDVILLSPGCSSHDMFRNFEERGDYFKKLVQQF